MIFMDRKHTSIFLNKQKKKRKKYGPMSPLNRMKPYLAAMAAFRNLIRSLLTKHMLGVEILS